jgi:hypothetical protein
MATVAPEEKFWQRYSPHQELPLSALSSFLLHILVLGLLLLLAYLGWAGFHKPQGKLPEIVPVWEGPGGPKLEPSSDVPETVPPEPKREPAQAGPIGVPDKDRPALDPKAIPKPPSDLKSQDANLRKTPAAELNIGIFGEIDQATTIKLGSGPRKPGTDGPGPGGDPRKKGVLTPTEIRQLRWTLVIKASSGREYLDQLRVLGAFLAIPTGPEGRTYKVVRDLSGQGPPKLLNENVPQGDIIFWRDSRPESVRALMAALHYSGQPAYFDAYMPKKLEKEMLELELKYQNLREEQIYSTTFTVDRTPTGYRVRVEAQQAGH